MNLFNIRRYLLENDFHYRTKNGEKISPGYFSLSFLALLVLMLANLSWATPRYNWDVIGYVATAHSFTQDDPATIHADTYAEIEAHVPPATYRNLIGEGNVARRYRAGVAADPRSLMEQIPLYSVKPLYAGLMLALSKLGMSLVEASVLISQAAYLLIGVLLFFWFSRYYPPGHSFMFSALAMSLPFVLYASRLSTPDALSAAILLTAFFLLVETPLYKTAFLLLAISVTARPENIILIIFLSAYSLLSSSGSVKNKIFILGTVAVGLALYAAGGAYAVRYDWSALSYLEFRHRLIYPGSEPASLTIIDFINILIKRSRPTSIAGTNSYSLVLFLLLSLATLKIYFSGWLTENKKFSLIFANFLFVGAHWVLYPSSKERQLVAWFLLTLVLLITGIQEKLRGNPQSRREGID